MKKAIEILRSYIRIYQGMVEVYNTNPHNQAISEHTAKIASENIISLQEAITALEVAMIGNKICPNCKYRYVSGFEVPCKECYSFDKWLPIMPPREVANNKTCMQSGGTGQMCVYKYDEDNNWLVDGDGNVVFQLL